MSMQSINLAQLGALHTTQDVHDLFRHLGYPVETPDAFVGGDLDYLELDPADRANVVRAYIVARLNTHTVYLYEMNDLRTVRLRSLAWHILQRGTGLLIVTTPAERGAYREIIFVDPRLAGKPIRSSVRVNKLKVITADPTRHDLDTLNAIHAHRRTAQQVYDEQGKAFNVITVTKRFYDEYRGHYERAKAAIAKANPGVRDFYDANKLHAFTQRLLGRLMFLYFLQRKGWLGERTRFLTERYAALQRQHAGETGDGDTYHYYTEVLEPLFFQTLNTRRPGDITRWEGIRIPYLNGGLFDEARDPSGPILIPDALFDPNDATGLLGFFNRYNFTIASDTPLEQDVAVDPEMLGKVFENLLEERDRGQSGSFYTPRAIVAYMCQEALAGYLQESADVPRETTRALFDPDADGHGALTPDEAVRVNAALDTLTVLDPAVGSGSFLIGMMNEILRLRLAAWRVLTASHPPSPVPHPPSPSPVPHPPSPSPIKREGERTMSEGDDEREGERTMSEGDDEDEHTAEEWNISPVLEARMQAIARQLRRDPTRAEQTLWQALRKRQIDGRKFRRQVAVGAFVVDFYCPSERLAVEVDGGIHETQQEADRERQSLIESLGIRFVRLSNEDVERRLPAALDKIRAAFRNPPSLLVGEGDGGWGTAPPALPVADRDGGWGTAPPALPVADRDGGWGTAPPALPVADRDGGWGTAPPSLVAQWKEAIIRDTLYGVDIKPEAIEIAQLRLWLALVVDQPLSQARPLPNLDYKLMAGNSLIETIDGVPVLTDSAAALIGTAAQAMQGQLPGFSETDTARRKLDEMRRAYFSAEPDERKKLKPDILHQERVIVRTGLGEQAQHAQERIDAFGKRAAIKTLTSAEKSRLTAAADKLARMTRLLDEMDAPGYAPPFFLYRLHFSEVFERKGGFDIVVANPPYVRGELLGAQKDEFKVTPIYADVYAGSADLYVYFFARGYHLLKPGGQLAYITSNKYLRANYGKGLRKFLAESLAMRAVIDFGDLPVFDAAAYPCIVIGEKAAPTETVPAASVKSMDALEDLPRALANGVTLKQSDLLAGEWQISGSDVQGVFVKLQSVAADTLRTYIDGEFFRGPETGLNSAFIIDEETYNQLIIDDPHVVEVLHPILRGRNVKRWIIENPKEWIIYAPWDFDIDAYPSVKLHLLKFAEQLKARPEVQRGIYPWYALRRYGASFAADFKRGKIIYSEFGIKPEFAYDTNGFFLTNKLFTIPRNDLYLLGVLNSNVIHFALRLTASSIRGGYIEFRGVTVEQLPIPNPPADLRERIADAARACLDAAAAHPDRLPALESALNALVYQAYGLDAADIAVIEGSIEKTGVNLEGQPAPPDEGDADHAG